jgi:hypothetical protein
LKLPCHKYRSSYRCKVSLLVPHQSLSICMNSLWTIFGAHICPKYSIFVLTSASLFNPDEDTLTKLIASWEGYAETLRGENRDLFKKMLKECYQYSQAINAKGEPFADEALLMSLIFSQHKMIDLLFKHIAKLESKKP